MQLKQKLKVKYFVYPYTVISLYGLSIFGQNNKYNNCNVENKQINKMKKIKLKNKKNCKNFVKSI